MNRLDEPAFPSTQVAPNPEPDMWYYTTAPSGLTVREYVWLQAMTGALADPALTTNTVARVADDAVAEFEKRFCKEGKT